MNELHGNLEAVYKALKELNITPIIAEYDEVWISAEDYHIHKNELARRGII